MKHVVWLWLSFAFFSVGVGADLSSLPSDANLPLRVKQTTLPVFPRSLLQEGVTGGWARVVIDVDVTGSLSDYLVVEHTRPEFGEAAVGAIRRWEFLPMLIRGQPTASQVAVGFRYEARGVVVDITHGTDVSRLWMQNARDTVYRPKTLRELDGIPVPQGWVDPAYSADLEKRGIVGSATIEFYIDEKGAVRMPAIVRADFPELGQLLADAVRQWKFEPPTQRGRPVLVHASQTVVFGKSP
jgi:TonB family protein